MFINEAIVNVTIPLVSTGSRGVQPEQSSGCFAFAGRRWVAGGGGETPPPRSSGALGIPSSEFIYFFISQNEDIFPVLERIEWQIPYSDIFGNHPGGFVV